MNEAEKKLVALESELNIERARSRVLREELREARLAIPAFAFVLGGAREIIITLQSLIPDRPDHEPFPVRRAGDVVQEIERAIRSGSL